MSSQSATLERPGIPIGGQSDEIVRNGSVEGNEGPQPQSAVDSVDSNAALDKVLYSDVSQPTHEHTSPY